MINIEYGIVLFFVWRDDEKMRYKLLKTIKTLEHAILTFLEFEI